MSFLNTAMKTISTFIFTLLLFGVVVSPTLAVNVISIQQNTGINFSNQQVDFNDLANLSAKEFGRKRGKKLKFKEKIAFWIVHHQFGSGRNRFTWCGDDYADH